MRGRGGRHGDGLVILLGGGAVGARVASAGQTEGRERGDGEQRAEKLLVTHG